MPAVDATNRETKSKSVFSLPLVAMMLRAGSDANMECQKKVPATKSG